MTRFRHLLLVLVAAAAAPALPAAEPMAKTGAEPGASVPVVLITGSNRGIGLEFTRQFAARGWRVIATARNPARATELTELAKREPRVQVEQLDLTDPAGIAALDAKLADTPIDILINNAALLGPFPPQEFGQLDYRLFGQILATNVVGTLRVTEAFVDQVAASEQKKIITLGSAAGSNGALRPPANLYAYRASKAALHMTMHNLAMDLAPRGIRVGLINPGLVDTRGVLDRGPDEPVPEEFRRLMPLIERGILPLIRPAESVSAMLKLIDGLTAEQSGQFLNYDGQTMPW